MMQDTLNSFFSQLEPAPWLCYVFPVLALGPIAEQLTLWA